MTDLRSPRIALLILWLTSQLFAIGCKRGSATGEAPAPGPQEPGRQAPVVKVQLSDPRAEAVLEVVNDRPVFLAHCKVKYRFIEGAPQSGMWYWFSINLGDEYGVGILKKVEGSLLKGELEQEHLLYRAKLPSSLKEMRQLNIQLIRTTRSEFPKQVAFQAQQAPRQGGPYRDIGDKVSCELKVEAEYPVP